MEGEIAIKACTTCKEEKSATSEYFYRDKSRKDGLFPTCKKCKKEYDKKHYQENKEHYAEYYEENKEEISERKRKHRQENKEKYREYDREHYQENKKYYSEYGEKRYQENREYYRKYYQENKEKIIEYDRNYRLENPEVSRMIEQRRRARMAELPHTLTVEEWEEALEYFDYSCAYCGVSEEILHQEHVIPVVKGGGYTADNIIPACKSCNSSKHARDMEEWYSEQEFFNIERLLLLNEWIEAGIGEAEGAMEEER